MPEIRMANQCNILLLQLLVYIDRSNTFLNVSKLERAVLFGINTY